VCFIVHALLEVVNVAHIQLEVDSFWINMDCWVMLLQCYGFIADLLSKVCVCATF